ncbi:hypothetical protein Droror1_Dr00019272 [Drosera rotundifolia]
MAQRCRIIIALVALVVAIVSPVIQASIHPGGSSAASNDISSQVKCFVGCVPVCKHSILCYIKCLNKCFICATPPPLALQELDDREAEKIFGVTAFDMCKLKCILGSLRDGNGKQGGLLPVNDRQSCSDNCKAEVARV